MIRYTLFLFLIGHTTLIFGQSEIVEFSDGTQYDDEIRWNKDTAYLIGRIEGYDPSLGVSGIVTVMDLFLHRPKSYYIEIDPTGHYYAEIPLFTSQETVIWLSDNFHVVFLTPGKTSRYDFKVIKGDRMSIHNKEFSGYNARLNEDLRELDAISFFDPYKAWKDIIDKDIYWYRDYCLTLMKRELDALDFMRGSISELAFRIKELKIKLGYYEEIFYFNKRKQGALRSVGDKSEYKEEVAEPDFYKFIDTEIFRDEKVLLLGNELNSFINKARYVGSGIKVDQLLPYKSLVKGLKENPGKLSPYQNIITALSACNGLEGIDSVKRVHNDEWVGLEETYFDQLRELRTNVQWDLQDKKFRDYIGLEGGFLIEIINSRRLSTAHNIYGYSISQSDISDKVKDPFIRMYLSENLLEEADHVLVENTMSRENDMTISGAYDLSEVVYYLGNEMNQFEGKILYIDFWATWCGPCLRGIKQIGPVKEELKDKPIEFIYFTNHTSNSIKYDEMIKDIEGTHFKLDEDTWNMISSKFHLSAIPHYTIVDRDGKIVYENFIPKSASHIKRTLVELLD